MTEGVGASLGLPKPPPVLVAGAIAASELLNAGDPVHRDWSVAAMTGVRAAGPDLLHLSLTAQTGLEVARTVGTGLEVFGQGWLDTQKNVTALGGLRWRF